MPNPIPIPNLTREEAEAALEWREFATREGYAMLTADKAAADKLRKALDTPTQPRCGGNGVIPRGVGVLNMHCPGCIDCKPEDSCPTCGQPVKVITGDEGTSHFEPVADSPMVERRTFEVWVCPGCGEQITDEPELDQKRGVYVRGHYHDPPPDHEGEDPWFDAVRIVIPATQPDRQAVLKELEEELLGDEALVADAEAQGKRPSGFELEEVREGMEAALASLHKEKGQ